MKTTAQNHGRDWFSAAWLAGGMLVATVLFLTALPWSPDSPAQAAAAGDGDDRRFAYAKIEDIRVGDRVITEICRQELAAALADQPDRPEFALERIDPEHWRAITLRMDRENGSVSQFVLLRPLDWIDRVGAAQGQSIEMSLPEQGLEGLAEVVAIEPCPPIQDGPGRIVTGTFTHVRGGILNLRVNGLDSEIGVTNNHPIYSVDRGQFVPAMALRVGERLRHLNGISQVASITQRPNAERVYNIEVHGDHVYRVTTLGVLVHNTTPMTDDQVALKDLIDEATLGGRQPLSPADADTVLDWADEVNYPGVRASPNDVLGDHWIGPHIHIPGAGRGGHVPVAPGVNPRVF